MAAESPREFLGLRLSHGASALLDDVERLYGRAISAEKKAFPGERWGTAEVAEDGTPIVRVSPAALDEDVIVHELFHLKLQAEGAPVFLWSSDGDAHDLNWLVHAQNQIYAALQHRSFADEMRRLNLDPAARIRRSLESAIENRTIGERHDEIGKAIILARVFLELGANGEFTVMRRLFVEQGWSKSVWLGNSMIRQLTPPSSDPAIQVQQFLSSLAALGVRVTLKGYQEVLLGSYREVRAIVEHRR
jgi:hypothetical protein